MYRERGLRRGTHLPPRGQVEPHRPARRGGRQGRAAVGDRDVGGAVVPGQRPQGGGRDVVA
uniref:Predicted protein n=1 Tax=Hordeum vulgare subsp. vulgare TaxID=112509 RepID=F2D4E2_HORVV|nr:predicted protein [Hordeum vulgare subsp. vulgare]